MTFAFVPSDEVARIRARLDHPVIDADGHLLEFLPLVNDLVREVAGDGVADRYQQFMRRALAPDDAGFMPARVFWGLPEEHTLDRMTVTLPAAHVPRAPRSSGLDFLLLYPSFGLTVLAVPDDEVRRAVARALNTYYAEVYAGYRDRLEPVAVIPTFTPEEAVDELDHAVGTLGLKAVVMNGVIPRSTRPDGSRRRVGRHARPRQPVRLRPALGPLRASSGWPPRSTASGTAGAAGSRRRTTCTTTWATSPPPRRRRAARW